MMRERDLCTSVQKFLKKKFHCELTERDKGTNYRRIDVIGLKQIRGDLSHDFELIGVEVKQANDAFLKSAGQSKGYSVYMNRCYLAKESVFKEGEIEIADILGIGLIEISDKVQEVFSSPRHTPSRIWQRKILFNVGQAVCEICGTIFPVKDAIEDPDSEAKGARKTCGKIE